MSYSQKTPTKQAKRPQQPFPLLVFLHAEFPRKFSYAKAKRTSAELLDGALP